MIYHRNIKCTTPSMFAIYHFWSSWRWWYLELEVKMERMIQSELYQDLLLEAKWENFKGCKLCSWWPRYVACIGDKARISRVEDCLDWRWEGVRGKDQTKVAIKPCIPYCPNWRWEDKLAMHKAFWRCTLAIEDQATMKDSFWQNWRWKGAFSEGQPIAQWVFFCFEGHFRAHSYK